MAGIEPADDDGGAGTPTTVTKRASDAVGRRALAHEAAVLGRLAHPGVIRLVAHDEIGGRAQLLTEKVPGLTLAELTVGSPTELAAIGAAGAAVVADLHALGIAHGGLAADHLIVSEGRIVLCSFGRAAEATADAMDRDVADLVVAVKKAAEELGEPATRVERRHRRRLDELLVASASRSFSAAELGAALALLAATPTDNGRHVPVEFASDRSSEERTAQPASPPVAEEAQVAGAPARPRRPTPSPPARPWRDRVTRLERARPGADDPAPGHRRRNLVIGASAGIVVVALWAGLRPGPQAANSTPSTTPLVAVPAEPTPATDATPMPSPEAPSLDPSVAVVGNFVAVDEVWFEVGRSGDVVRVGDWDCDGSATPAVLRPANGEIFVFDGWVDEAEVRRIEPLTVVSGATDIVRERTPACDTLVVIERSGRRAIVETTP